MLTEREHFPHCQFRRIDTPQMIEFGELNFIYTHVQIHKDVLVKCPLCKDTELDCYSCKTNSRVH